MVHQRRPRGVETFFFFLTLFASFSAVDFIYVHQHCLIPIIPFVLPSLDAALLDTMTTLATSS
jgi:hypothetical protein